MNLQKIIDSLCVCIKNNPDLRGLKVDVDNSPNIPTNSKNESQDKIRLHNLLKGKNDNSFLDDYNRILTYNHNNIKFLENKDKKNIEKPFFYRNFTLKNGIIHEESEEKYNKEINNQVKINENNKIENKKKENKKGNFKVNKTINSLIPQEQQLLSLNKKKNIKTFTYSVNNQSKNIEEQFNIINSDINKKEGIVQEVINEKSAFKEFQNNMDDIIKKSLGKRQYSESDD